MESLECLLKSDASFLVEDFAFDELTDENATAISQGYCTLCRLIFGLAGGNATPMVSHTYQ